MASEPAIEKRVGSGEQFAAGRLVCYGPATQRSAPYLRRLGDGVSSIEEMCKPSSVVTESSSPITTTVPLPMITKSGCHTETGLPLDISKTKGLKPFWSRSRMGSRFIVSHWHKCPHFASVVGLSKPLPQ